MASKMSRMKAKIDEQKWTNELMRLRITGMVRELEETQKLIEANMIQVNGFEKLLKKNVESLGEMIDSHMDHHPTTEEWASFLEEKKHKLHDNIEDVFVSLMAMKKLYMSMNEQTIDSANKVTRQNEEADERED